MHGARTAPNKYCNINSFLRQHAPTLFENIEDLCMMGSLSTKKVNGLTILLPDKKTLGHINKTVASNVDTASKLIGALIIPMNLPTINDFDKYKNSIPNSNGNKVEIKTCDPNTGIIFANGTRMDKKNIYVPSFVKSRVSVYNIDGLMSNDGSPAINIPTVNGGNDTDIKTTRCDSGRTLELLLKSAKINATLQAEMAQNDHILTLGISLINYMINGNASDFCSSESKQRLNMIGKICRRVHPHSPLYYLHLIPLLTDEEKAKWCDVILMYSKYDMLAGFMKEGYDRKLENKWDTSIVNVVRTFKRNTICETAKHVFTERCNEALAGLDPCYDAWGGCDEFVCWLMGVAEFTYLYSDHYMKAIANRDTEEINTIIDTYIRWYIIGNKSYSSKLILLDDSLSNNILIFTKERFCTILSFTLSRAFSPMGCNFPQRGSQYVHSDNVTVSDEHAPNKIIVSAYITCKFAEHVSRYLKS